MREGRFLVLHFLFATHMGMRKVYFVLDVIVCTDYPMNLETFVQ